MLIFNLSVYVEIRRGRHNKLFESLGVKVEVEFTLMTGLLDP